MYMKWQNIFSLEVVLVAAFRPKRSDIWLNDADTRKQELDETAALAPPQINDEQ